MTTTSIKPIGEPLTQEQFDKVQDGARIIVLWHGGNGPHRYRLVRTGDRADCYLHSENVHVGEVLPVLDKVWIDAGASGTGETKGRENWALEDMSKWRAPDPDKKPREPGCQCTWEEGDSPCPVHPSVDDYEGTGRVPSDEAGAK